MTKLSKPRASFLAAISASGAADGVVHAETLHSDFYLTGDPEGSSDDLIDLLESAAKPSNDWGTSSSEAWWMTHGQTSGSHSKDDEARLIYCEAYEKAARQRCAELAAEMRATAEPEAV